MSTDLDSHFMKRAMELARLAGEKGEIPVGAVVVRDGPQGPEIVAESGNCKETSQDPLGHAEILAIRAASAALGRWRLAGCTLYVTLEPCTMCAGAIVHARLDRLVYGARDPKAGAVESLYQVLRDERLNHLPQVTSGVEADACSQQLSAFFRQLREARRSVNGGAISGETVQSDQAGSGPPPSPR